MGSFFFVDLKKAYNKVHRDRLLQILEGYGASVCLQCLLSNFWNSQQVVACQVGYYGTLFQAHNGVTQGRVISPMLFNIVVDVSS